MLFAIIFVVAVLGALVFIGIAIFRSRKKSAALNDMEAAEIASTWNLLNH
jgi:Flp pilus assembly protein protease CpaA